MSTMGIRLTVMLAAVLGAGLLAGCSGDAAGSANARKGAPKPAVAVRVGTVVEKAVPVQLRAIGNVEAYATVSVRSQVDGQLVQVHFREGQEVKRGDMLFTIDPRPFVESLRQAEADLARDKAQLENARLDEERYRELMKKDYASRETYDKMVAQYNAMKATVQADEAAVSNAKLKLEYTAIQSPVDGQTGDYHKNLGNVIKAKDDELVVINQIHPIYATFAVPEVHLPDIKRYMSAGPLAVEATVANHDNLRARGQLTFVNNTVDVGTGSIQLKATFPNQDNVLWPGQFVNVTLSLTTRPDAVVAPSQAVQAGQNGTFVYVVKPDLTVEPRQVVTGSTLDGFIIIEQGLKPGETVVTDGHLRLSPGAKVDIKQEMAPAGPAGAAASAS